MSNLAAQPQVDPRIGMVLHDRYRVVRKIGDGGMGTVYEGEHVLIRGKRVAIKILHSQYANNPEIIARFQREAEAATAIGHPNIIEVNDLGRFADGTTFMVLEFLEGRDWAKDIQTEGPQPLGKIVHIMGQVCDALGAAHAKGIVHRDLKPENVFLIRRGDDPNFVKVLDFGISKIADASSENRSLTQSGTALGTPYYMSPEQCQGKKDVDPRSDVYSLGVILFQALTRQYPFDDESYPMLVLKICTQVAPRVSDYRPDLPPVMQTILTRMLAKERQNRFSSCAEVKEALEPFRHVHDAPVVRTDIPSTAVRPPAVLGGAAGPVHTPAGTAYLPTEYDQTSYESAPAPVEAKSSAALYVVLGLLAFFILVLGAGGVIFAFNTMSGDPPPPRRHQRETLVTRPPPHDPQPAAQTQLPVPPPPVNVPTAPAAERINLRVLVEGPQTAQIYIDGELAGPSPFDADVVRDEAPQPGQHAPVHVVEARAEGWHAAPQSVPFRIPQRVTLRMQRTGRASTVRHRHNVGTTQIAPPPPPVVSTPIRPRQTPRHDLVDTGSMGLDRFR